MPRFSNSVQDNIVISASSRSDASTREFAALLDAAVDAIVVIDDKGGVNEFNAAAEIMFGFTREEILGRNVSVLMPPNHGEHHDEYIARHIRTGERRIIGRGREVEGRRRDGTTFPLYLSVGRAQSDAGISFVGILRDISERRRYESEITRQQQDISRIGRRATAGELAAALAHELNQPLAAIATFSGAAKRFLERAGTDEEAMAQCRTALEQIEQQSLRAGDVIGRIRTFVGSDDTAHDRVSARELINEIVPILELDTRAEGVSLSTSLSGGDLILDVDKIQIQQVLINLVRNAVDATAEVREQRSPAVRLETRIVDANRLAFKVSDNGSGIPDAFVDDLFTPFRSTKKSGLGMGLAISKSIIEAHADTIRFETSREGTSFEFCLPVTDT